jgi:hypothetical protein
MLTSSASRTIQESRCQCHKTFYCGNLLLFHCNTIIPCYKMILLWLLLWNVGIRYQVNLPWYNLRKSRYCSKLPWYFYNTGQKYHSILTLEKGGTMVNYCGIFITLAQCVKLVLIWIQPDLKIA